MYTRECEGGGNRIVLFCVSECVFLSCSSSTAQQRTRNGCKRVAVLLSPTSSASGTTVISDSQTVSAALPLRPCRPRATGTTTRWPRERSHANTRWRVSARAILRLRVRARVCRVYRGGGGGVGGRTTFGGCFFFSPLIVLLSFSPRPFYRYRSGEKKGEKRDKYPSARRDNAPNYPTHGTETMIIKAKKKTSIVPYLCVRV